MSGPGGVPKVDVAAQLARAIIEDNQGLIYKAFVKALSKGNACCLQVLADCGYGKLRETRSTEVSRFDGVSDEDLEKHIKEWEERLANEVGYLKADLNYYRLRTIQTQTDRIWYRLHHSKRLLFSSL